MEKEFMMVRMEINIKEHIKMMKKMDMECSIMESGTNMKDNTTMIQ